MSYPTTPPRPEPRPKSPAALLRRPETAAPPRAANRPGAAGDDAPCDRATRALLDYLGA